MKTKNRDFNSYIAIIDSFIDRAELPQEDAKIIKKELKTYITTRFEKNKWFHPEITKFCTDWYREFYRLVDNTDPYKKLKEESNKKAQEVIATINPTTFEEYIAAGIIGNRIDYGACLIENYNLETMQKDFENLKNFTLHFNDSKRFKEKLVEAKNVLFLVDNNGEIIFDTFLLKELQKYFKKEDIYIMAKESPMLNDVTIDELKDLGFEKYGTLLSTGSNCFGLHKEDVSEECKKYLKETDLIIAKGQAYFEFFTEYSFRNVINILRVKYPIVNPALGDIDSGVNMLITSERYASYGKSYF